MNLNIFLLLCLIAKIDGSSWNYNWKCTESKKCIRQLVNCTSSTTYYESQDVCRLICGEHGALWPIPTGMTRLGSTIIPINMRRILFNIVPATKTEVFLENMSEQFLENLNMECVSDCNEDSIQQIKIDYHLSSDRTSLTWTTDESYELDVSTQGNYTRIKISAGTVFGIRHGLETLTQLIAVANGPSTMFKNTLYLVSSVYIKDAPIYPHRGLLIDTARNFIPINHLKRTMDGMAASKLNVFHWHATDSQSFPLEMPSVPKMTRHGAYSPQHIYTPENVVDLVQYGLYRGIRVLIEMDMPSHSGNGWQWGPENGIGNLAVCINKQPWRKSCIQPPCGQLNPVNHKMFTVLSNIFRDIGAVIPTEETVHMGGDEVFLDCWNQTKEITDYMTAHGYGLEDKDFLKIWSEFHANALLLWDEVNEKREGEEEKVIVWSSQLTDPEHIEKYLDKNRFIIQTWVPSTDEMPKKLLDKGYKLIMSTKNAWYFDHGFWGITSYYPWKTVYANKIIRQKGVLGGEACVWTELIDENSLDTRTWPRAAAVAERLWSDPNLLISVVEPRFYRHRNRLIRRGLKAEALAPKYCIQNEGECF